MSDEERSEELNQFSFESSSSSSEGGVSDVDVVNFIAKPTIEKDQIFDQNTEKRWGSYLFYGIALNFEWFGCLFPELAYFDPSNLGYYRDQRVATNISLSQMYELFEEIQTIFSETELFYPHLLEKIYHYADLDRFDKKRYDYILGQSLELQSDDAGMMLIKSPFSALSDDELDNCNLINQLTLPELLNGFFQPNFCWHTFFELNDKYKGGWFYREEQQFILGCLLDLNYDEARSYELDLMTAYQTPNLFEFQEFVANNPRLSVLNYSFIHYDGYLARSDSQIIVYKKMG